MEEVIKRTKSQYVIIRGNGKDKEYFSGADLYGRDNEGILIVSNVRWSKIFIPMGATYNQNKVKDILDGMRKYGEIEKGYNYVIAEIQITTAIINYMEQG